VDEAEKRRLLAGAYGLLFPIDWPEPTASCNRGAGLQHAVLAMNRGAVPELLRHGMR
jgi:hypothetical protein